MSRGRAIISRTETFAESWLLQESARKRKNRGRENARWA
jgi:hypothetical protein